MSHSPERPSSAAAPTHPHHLAAMPKTYPQFLLFGDSITQGASHGLAAPLSEWYLRRVDVLNRGFSGYTAPAAYDNLVQFFPPAPPASRSSCSTPRVVLMTVFFGANDACVPGAPQHVPLDQYRDALRQIVEYEGVRAHGTRVIVIVPPPVDEWQLTNADRTADNTARYAAACRAVGRELGVPTLDVWTIFMRKAGWTDDAAGPLVGSKHAPRSPVLASLLSDGLHLTPVAYQIVFDELAQLIQTDLPDHVPDRLPWIFPDWRQKLEVPE